MTARARAYRAAAAVSASRPSPLARSMSNQSVERAQAANASKPCVCSAMNAVSSTRGMPCRAQSSSDSMSALHRPRIAGIAARAHLMVLSADLRLGSGQHLGGRLRIREAHESGLAQRIEGDDRNVPATRILQLMQHARTARAYVLPEEENAIRLVEVLERHGADRRADRLRQRDRRRFVAHIRAVRQIVASVHA